MTKFSAPMYLININSCKEIIYRNNMSNNGKFKQKNIEKSQTTANRVNIESIFFIKIFQREVVN